MRVLVLDEEFPYPTNTGKRTRSFNLYRRLAARYQIRYVAYGTADSEAAYALQGAGIEPVAVPAKVPAKQGLRFYMRLFANLFSPLPYIVTSHYSQIYRQAVRDQLNHFQPHILLCEWTPYAEYAREHASPRKLLSAHNIEADIWQRYYDTERNPFRRWYIGEQRRKILRFERSALAWVDSAVAVSEQDRARIVEMCPGLLATVVPNGVDLDYFRPIPEPTCRRHLVFTGSMDWRPNQDAARYFMSEILPLLRRARADVECSFVGRDPPAEIRELGAVSGVHVTGTVDDVRPFVERAAVYVVPLRIGGGSRLKILEAMAMGRAVVSTTIGAEGLDVVHGRHIILADSPRDFALAVLRLLDDPQLSANLAREGRRLAERAYGWDSLASRLSGFIRDVASTGLDRRASAVARAGIGS